MGFGVGNIPVAIPPIFISIVRTHFQSTPSKVVFMAINAFQKNPGNYTVDSLLYQLNLQWNRFFFDGGVTNDPSTRPMYLYFQSSSGVAHNISINYGSYTPDTFAEYLQAQMNISNTTNTYTVTWGIWKQASFVFKQ